MIKKCGYEEFRVEKSEVEISRFEKLQDISTPYFSTPSFKPSNFNPNMGAILCKTNETAVLPGFWKIDWAGQYYSGLAWPKFLVAPLPLPKFMIEKCGYEDFRVEMSGVENFGVEISCNLWFHWGLFDNFSWNNLNWVIFILYYLFTNFEYLFSNHFLFLCKIMNG